MTLPNRLKSELDFDMMPASMQIQQQIDIRYLAHYNNDLSDWLAYQFLDLREQIATRLFEEIGDGGFYSIRLVAFAKGPEEFLNILPSMGIELNFQYADKILIGYRVCIRAVETIYNFQHVMPKDYLTDIPDYRPPTWIEIAKGIKKRVRCDLTIPSIFDLFIRQILARILYLPDKNPHFWGVKDD